MAARYGKGTADYINCPFTKEEYDRFIDALTSAEMVEGHDWENLNYFEGCLPIEEIARRGRDTLRFGPMKPVGLDDPRTGKWPYAVVQLRQENLRADSYNLVGFQNHLKFGDQARVLRLIPGLENAKFVRYGQIHRNTYINAPRCSRSCSTSSNIPASFSLGRFPALKVIRSPSPWACWRVFTWRALLSSCRRFRRRARRRSVRWCTTSATLKAKVSSRPTSRLICLPQLDEATRRRVRDKKQRHKMVCDLAMQALDTWLAQCDAAAALQNQS